MKKNIMFSIAIKLLKILGYTRIDQAWDKETKKVSGMVFSRSESFTNEYMQDVVDKIHTSIA
jgi:hypothetical protein